MINHLLLPPHIIVDKVVDTSDKTICNKCHFRLKPDEGSPVPGKPVCCLCENST